MTPAEIDRADARPRWAVVSIVVLWLLFALPFVTAALGHGGIVEAGGGPWLPVVIAFPVTASLLTWARPDLGYSRLTLAVTAGLMLAMAGYALGETLDGSAAAWASTLADATNTTSVVLALGLLMLLFPDGRPTSPRWWIAVGVSCSAALTGGLAALVTGGWGGDADQAAYASPLADSFGGAGGVLTAAFYPQLMLMLVCAAVSVVLRFRTREGIERKQMQWLVVAAAYTGMIVLTSATVGSMNKNAGGFDAVFTGIGFALIPAAIAVAVLRYRLYDVDVVINRSLMIAGLALFILVVYVTTVVGIGTLLTGTGEPNLALQIGATAIVAVGFQPWRRRMRRWADRMVYGHRASPYEVLGSFASIAARTPDDDTRHRIAELLASGTGADPAVVWLRVGDRLRPVAAQPPDQLPAADVPVAGEAVSPQVPGDLVVAVEHDGQLLGALSITKGRGEVVNEQDVDLTHRLATGVALTLRTERLTAELAQRLDELSDSRARIVQAQDEARRRLERDLHDGAQQQLVALKVKLGLARTMASKVEAERTAQLLAQIGTDADDAVASLRDLARGIYPPLLEAEGLRAALGAQARKAALPVSVTGTTGRHPRDVEVAVYFCVLEALQNAAKYSEAGSVTIGPGGRRRRSCGSRSTTTATASTRR